ncbi:hypothetical protein [Dysgonomonas reticulitermitis]
MSTTTTIWRTKELNILRKHYPDMGILTAKLNKSAYKINQKAKELGLMAKQSAVSSQQSAVSSEQLVPRISSTRNFLTKM